MNNSNTPSHTVEWYENAVVNSFSTASKCWKFLGLALSFDAVHLLRGRHGRHAFPSRIPRGTRNYTNYSKAANPDRKKALITKGVDIDEDL